MEQRAGQYNGVGRFETLGGSDDKPAHSETTASAIAGGRRFRVPAALYGATGAILMLLRLTC